MWQYAQHMLLPVHFKQSVSQWSPAALFLSASVKSLSCLLSTELYYPPHQIWPPLTETNTSGGRRSFSIAVWRWTAFLTPAVRSEMDNGFGWNKRGWGGQSFISSMQSSTCFHLQGIFLPFFSWVYLWKPDRTHMLLSAMFCFTVAPLHTFWGDVHERAAVHGRLLGVAQGDGRSRTF